MFEGIAEEFGARRSSLVCVQRRRSCSLPSSPLSLSDAPHRLSFSYQKLPSHHLCKLSVLKLDGSSFDVQTSGTATVSELKQAVEDVFTQSPRKDQGQISWSHVWGHFCLCFEGQKLINNKDYIRSFGIQDGCQLYFIRHLSINFDSMKRPPRKENSTYKQNKITLAGSDICEEEEHGDGEDIIEYPKFKLAHFLKGWVPYPNLRCFRRTRKKCNVQPSRFSGHFLKLGSKLTFMRL